MQKFTDLFKSRKFWAAVIGVILVVAHHFDPNFPLSDANVTELIYVLVAYIIGTGLEGLRAPAVAK